MKDQIFISHATPEDNEFTIWLASRLEMLGYKVWIDKNELLGGERFWPTIQKAIDASKKVLLVYSMNITREGVLKAGIEREFEYANSVASSKGYSDFVIPLHIDNSNYHLAIGFPNLNQIPFNNNWADGLKQLKKKLDKDGILYDEQIDSSLSEWYENNYITDCQIESKKEVYYSSWWTTKEMPQSFYMYQFSNQEQAKAVRESNKDIPVAQLSNILSTFDGNLNCIAKRNDEIINIPPSYTYTYKLDDILFGFESDRFPSHKDVENHFKDFLRYLLYTILWNKGMVKTELSGRKYVFYQPKYGHKFPYIEFDYPPATMAKNKRKTLGGTYKRNSGYWHYGISLLPVLFPYIGASIKSHLVFTTDGFKPEKSQAKQHSYRRNKGRNFFNEEWKDLLLAFIFSLRNDNGDIELVVNKDGDKLVMNNRPEWFWSDYGYNDPSKKMDIESVEHTQDEEEDLL